MLNMAITTLTIQTINGSYIFDTSRNNECVYTIIGKTEDDFEEYSSLPIKNCFNGLSFGGYTRGIYGSTLAETLHTILFGFYDYIPEGVEFNFTGSEIDLLSHVVVSIYQDSRR